LEKSYDIFVSDTILLRKQYPMKFLSLAVAMLWMVLGVAGQSTFAADNVKISISNVEGSFLFGAVAAKKGFFAQENLNGELIRIAGNVMVPALANGDIDYTLMFGSVVRATLSNFPFKVVGSFVDSPTGALVGKAAITAPQSLKGKSIAVSSFGAGAYVTAVLTVQHLGMSPNEVKFVASGGDAGRLAALQNGLVDAALLNPAAAARAETLGFRVIAKSYELFTFPYAGLGTTNKKLAEKPAEVKRVLRALIKGSRYMRENRDETIQVLSDWAKIDRQSASDYYDATWKSSSPDGSIPEKGLRLVIEDAKSALKINRDISFSEVADDSLVKEVQREMKLKGR
jgi:ABC-type nitrate/sulfonate/bicarbonate transport system substrate-binding protein